MDTMLAVESRYRDHYVKVANVDRDGWKKPNRAPRVYRVALAKTLIALAVRLAPSVWEQSRESGRTQTATA